MADDRQLFTQELSSAKYLVNSPEPESVEPVDPRPVRRAAPPRSGLEQAMRWISPLVLVMLLAAGVGLYFHHEDSIDAGMSRFQERTSNPIDFVLWIGGSDKTFSEGLQDSLEDAQRKTEAEFKEMQAAQPKFKFDSGDFENPWSPQDN